MKTQSNDAATSALMCSSVYLFEHKKITTAMTSSAAVTAKINIENLPQHSAENGLPSSDSVNILRSEQISRGTPSLPPGENCVLIHA